MATASRTAFLIVVLALICMVLLYKTKRRFVKILFIIAGCWVIISGYNSILGGDNTLATRMETTTDDNNLSGRDSIWSALLPYVNKHPLFGVGQTGYVEISLEALSETKTMESGAIYGFSPHNVLLEVLLYTGIVGFIIMLLFWGKIGVAALKIYTISGNATFLLCLVPMLGCILSGQILEDKLAWMLCALIVSSEYHYKHLYAYEKNNLFYR
jgi:O-antigen ligase